VKTICRKIEVPPHSMIKRQEKRREGRQSRPNPLASEVVFQFFVLLVPLIPTAVSFVLSNILILRATADGLLFAF
jgi:hypothetical protein